MAAGTAKPGVSKTKEAAPLGLAVLLACMSSLSPFSIDTFFPSFRVMQADFGVTALQMQQTITGYLLPYAIMSLFHGSLSDALGRRVVVLGGLAVYAVASFACMLAPGFGTLLLFRAAQGVSAGAGMVVARAVVRDLYDGAAAQRLMSTIMMLFSLAPAIAPIIGGWIHVWAGWRAVFGMLTLLALVLLLACYWRLPETHPLHRRISFGIAPLLRGSWQVFSDTKFRCLAFASALSFSAFHLYVAAAPAIIFDHWHLSETQFGSMFVPGISGMALGAWLSGRFAGRVHASHQILYGFAISFSAALLITLAHLSSASVPIYWQQLALAVLALGIQFAAPVLNISMLDLFPHMRGTASSVLNCLSLLLSTFVMGFVGPHLQHSMALLSAYGIFVTLLAALLWRLSRTEQ